MSTITKEWLKQKIADMEAARDEIPFGLGEDDSNTLAALRIALASLEAEAVAYLTKSRCMTEAITEHSFGGDTASMHRCAKHSNWIPLFTAPPAPVSVPEWTNEQCMEFLSIAFRHAEINGDLQLDDIRLGVKMVNDSRAAMLQGAEHVSNRDELADGWVMVPVDMTPEQMRAVQIKSELGSYAAANLQGAYALFREFWDVAIAAAPQQEA
ncbi:hypothetical protein [Enterobacter cloacae]|uniref:hypothetical protein n=1 Tax=Enterobacter cloacae TaxID=550 RepID=UPI002A816733|nr:hypothetical protein [Enterobacter cloacae]